MPVGGEASEGHGKDRTESFRMPAEVGMPGTDDGEHHVRTLLQQVSQADFSRETFASIFKENYMSAIEQHHAGLLGMQGGQPRPSSAPMNKSRGGQARERRSRKGNFNVSESIVNPGVKHNSSHKRRPLSASGSRAPAVPLQGQPRQRR